MRRPRKMKHEYNRLPITEEWADSVRDALGKGDSEDPQRDLAKIVGCDQSVISRIISMQTATSSFVEPISYALAIDLPRSGLTSEESRVLSRFSRLTEEERDLILRQMELFSKKSE